MDHIIQHPHTLIITLSIHHTYTQVAPPMGHHHHHHRIAVTVILVDQFTRKVCSYVFGKVLLVKDRLAAIIKKRMYVGGEDNEEMFKRKTED